MSVITTGTLYELLVRIEHRLDTIERTVAEVKSRQDNSDGEKRALVQGMRWLGPTGFAAVAWSILRGAGVL